MNKPLLTYKLYFYMRYIVICAVLVVTLPSPGMAQANHIQALLGKLNAAKQDTDRVNLYYSISRQYWGRNADSALLMAQKSLELAQKINFEKGIALAYVSKGVALGYKGKWPEALECHFRCLRISQKLGMEGLTGNEYNNISGMYISIEDYSKALYYNRQAYKIALKQNDPTHEGVVSLLINLGEIFKKKGQPDSSILYNTQALVIAKRGKNPINTTVALYNIGENYVTKKDYERAQVYFYKALAIAQKNGDDEDVAYCHNGLALTSYYTGNYNASMQYAQQGLQESKKSGIIELIATAYQVLYLTNQKKGSYKEALYYRNLEFALNDSLKTAEKEKVIRNIQSSYELEQKQRQIDVLNKDKVIGQKELERVRIRRDLLTAGAISLLIFAFVLFRSYAQKRKLSEQLARQNKDITAQNMQLEELVHVKDRLFSIIGHDLRGPIYTISHMMDVIKGDELSKEESKFWVGKVSDTLTITAHLVENLLYWSKSQMDGIQANPACFNVQSVIEQNVTLLKERAAEKEVKVTGVQLTRPETVYADEIMIDIVIRNLVENAVKFSKAGDTVTVSAEQKESVTIITVKDNGKGIPEEAQARIFDKFSSYTTYGTASEKGSGLGLLLCKELVERNNGTIWFESKAGVGSSFYFSIPSLNN
ncbi:tetratricopeptide repeat-containing sensor histidine kinase [Mucilaginibacter ginsenosidivorax]|uniref:histidine kinase n=1 Tax=Mucilaginibacter ginsenosidivorax TaxID=862126 RepID=A0A5B8VWF8_9SPHI|nr:tetratricopeptide repeat-containing sensor histidine kinase [Mucilaginibacter ginsenosidivorax]QEC75623.1 sensor histidine kinase [Mucilaginibacter ginsenosidivorax]